MSSISDFGFRISNFGAVRILQSAICNLQLLAPEGPAQARRG